ncbi:MAG: 1-acylglycerol-3-phosphate O-acyltransferase [Alteromonadaceae bacterium]
MLALIRIIFITLALVVICVLACVFSILQPWSRNRAFFTSRTLSKLAKLLGLEVEVRLAESATNIGPAVYVANHQSGLDMFTISSAVQPNTVTVGKKSLKWIPFFGQMYWLTGNILIDRANTNKAMGTITQTVKKIKDKNLSVWLFPEGTRSNGRGLLRFKTGAFRTAAEAGVPIVPVCSSNLHGAIKWNRWDNGRVIIEILPPVYCSLENKDNVRTVANDIHTLMSDKIEQLSIETGTSLNSHKSKEQENV